MFHVKQKYTIMKFSYWIYLFVISFVLSSFKPIGHPIHIGLTEIHYKAERNALEIAIRVFTDDFERAIKLETGKTLYLHSQKEIADADKYIEKFLQKKFMMKGNDEKLDLSFLGKTHEDLATWSFVEITNLPPLKKLEVGNRILLDIYDDQKNIVHIYKGRKHAKTFYLRQQKPMDVVRF